MSRVWTPYPHQELMLAHLARGPKLAQHSGCGAGKSAVAMTFIDESLHDRFDTRRWLIVAPKSVAEDTWQREAAKWDHLRHLSPRLVTFEDFGLRKGVDSRGKPALVFGGRWDTKRHLLAFPEPVHVCSYDALPWIVRATGKNFPYDGLVFDESVFLKSIESLRFRAAKHAINTLGCVSRVIEQCGTPIPKGYEDLMAQFILLDRGERLGASKTEFRDRWQEPDKRGKQGQVFSWKMRPDRVEPIRERIGELAMSVDRDIGVDVVTSLQYVKLPPGARRVYADMERDLIVEVAGATVLSANAAVMLGKLLQICNGHLYGNDGITRKVHDAKLDALQEALEAEQGPVLLPYPFQTDADALAARFGRSLRFSSEPGAIEGFRQGKFRVLAFHPASMAYGIDGLQDVCNTVFWFGVTHRFDHFHQVMKRLHREGQKKSTVFVRIFVADRTREEGIYNNVLLARSDQNEGLLRAIRG